MKKIYIKTVLSIFLISFIANGSFAQGNTLPTSGNIGIGTLTPSAPLQILKSSGFSDASSTSATIDNLMILQVPYEGSLAPAYNGTGYKWGIKFLGRNDGAPATDNQKIAAIYAVSEDGQMGYNRAIGLTFHTTIFDGLSTEQLRITSTGNVGIGTKNPSEKLTVKGNIGAQEIKVVANAGADYVFNKDYIVPSLREVEKYIAVNKHLPEIPSAKDMVKNGLDLGKMNVTLLKKIEELTLYLIEKDKKEREYEMRIAKLENNVRYYSKKNIHKK